jgi:hypothetical protein
MTMTTTMLAAAVLAAGVWDQKRPEWATETVPDTVVTLVERAIDTSDTERRIDLLREAEVHARASLGALPSPASDVGRRYALAVILGLRAIGEGGRGQVQAAAALSEELDLVLAAAPDHVGARHMLGRLHAGVLRLNRVTRWLATNLLGGDALSQATWRVAEENLAFAERHAPHVADHHLQLALLYRDTGRPDLAAAEVEHALDLTPRNALELAVRDEALEVRNALGQ